ncbi:MAG: pyruvate kinase [Candidatus Limiplasma sp.]|nr:pyruvate kinase [Candidatus Limiplasma sp.]
MTALRKTKIVCTLGPATEDDAILRAMIQAGMNVARLNFSHGTYEGHAQNIRRIRALSAELHTPVGIMLDTKGPEIRLKTFRDHRVTLQKGQLFTLCTGDVEGDAEHVSITYADLPADVQPGTTILIDDGLVGLTVEAVSKTEIQCCVNNGGVISDRKGINVPDANLSMPFISRKDREDILFGIQENVDFIAASFTRTEEDILAIRKLLTGNGGKGISIIAKIENMQGVQNIDSILAVSDGVMVARGDLGVEIPLEQIPIIQKMIIRKAYSRGKQIITATQMLDSMIKNPRPTRAEATDVANAIYDGTGAIMLSGETAAGLYPVEAVRTMARIAQVAEASIDYVQRFRDSVPRPSANITNAISHACCTSAQDLNATAVVTVTKTGFTAKMLSRFRPGCPIIACAPVERVVRQLCLSWGITPLLIEEVTDTDELFERAVDAGIDAGLLHKDDLIVMTAGVPLGISGTTNLMRVHVVGSHQW